MSDLNTVLRRVALCLTLLPLLISFTAISVVMFAPLLVPIAWMSGSRRPFSEVWEMFISDGPLTMFGDLWNGMP